MQKAERGGGPLSLRHRCAALSPLLSRALDHSLLLVRASPRVGTVRIQPGRSLGAASLPVRRVSGSQPPVYHYALKRVKYFVREDSCLIQKNALGETAGFLKLLYEPNTRTTTQTNVHGCVTSNAGP